MSVRVLSVADSDSYLKWGFATLQAMPATWAKRQVVVASPITPSRAQCLAATDGAEIEVLSATRLGRLLHDFRPDVVLLAATGPVVATLARLRALTDPRHRPVLVTGLPGIAYPASRRAVDLRVGCDLLLTHSRHERRAFAELAARAAPDLVVALARLPFLRSDRLPGGNDVVFAAQALVPAGRRERLAVLRALAAVPDPLRPVVKLRAAAGEEQTHRETWPYPELWAELVASGEAPQNRVRFVEGQMLAALQGARACVTVSSTAVLEAAAGGLEVLLIDDFGRSEELINLVFAGSGASGSLAELAAGRFRRPADAWCHDNYLHPDQDSDWLDQLDRLLHQRAHGRLPRHAGASVGRATALRHRLRLSALRGLYRRRAQRRAAARQTRAGAGAG